MATAIETMGDAGPLLAKLRFTDTMLGLIGGIAVLASNTENWTERAIWRVEGIDPAGKRPSTDAKQISELIRQLANAGGTLPAGEMKDFIELWCRAAEPAYRCRNSIFHGVTLPLGSSPWFAINTAWHGAVRKRPFSDFHADDNTLSLLQGAFGVLLRSIVTIVKATDNRLSADGRERDFAALRTATSVVIELADLAAAVNHEKY